MTAQDLQHPPAAGQAERAKLRRELSRLDTIFFLISAMVVVDTIGAIAIGGGQAFTWLVVLFVFFFIPSALASAELGAAIPDEGGAYVWVRMAFGRFFGELSQPALYGFGPGSSAWPPWGRWCPCATASGCRPAGPSGRSACSPSSPSASPSTAPATGPTASPSAT